MLQICIACTTAFSSGAETCPNCGSPDWIDEGTEFPKPEPVEPPKAKPTKGS